MEASGFYKGRLIARTPDNTLNRAISLGHFIYGDGIALNPDDTGYDVELLAHEYGHTYQSRIAGPLYLFKYGLASAVYQGSTEDDANVRAYLNLGIDPWGNVNSNSLQSNRTKWWEIGLSPVLWPFMWLWNK